MRQLIALSAYLSLFCCFFFVPIVPAELLTEVSPENSELIEYENNPNPLAQLLELGLFCSLKYPGNLNRCHEIATLFTLRTTLDQSYQSPHGYNLLQKGLFYMGIIAPAVLNNQGFDWSRLPIDGLAIELAITTHIIEIGADAGIRIWGYWLQNAKNDAYDLFKSMLNSAGIGLAVGSLLYLKPGVSTGYRMLVTVITAAGTMFLSFVVKNDGDINADLPLVAKAKAAAEAGAGAAVAAVTVAAAVAAVAAVFGVEIPTGTVRVIFVTAGTICTIAAAAVAAIAGAGAGAGAGAEAGAEAEAIAIAIAGASVGAVAGCLLNSVMIKMVQYDSRVAGNPLLFELLRLETVFVINEGILLTAQVMSYFNSGSTLSDSFFKTTSGRYDEMYENLLFHVLFWFVMWRMDRTSQS